MIEEAAARISTHRPAGTSFRYVSPRGGAGPILRFDGFELDAERRELRRDGRLVDIDPTPLRFLVYLAEHRDRFVSKHELLDRVWPEVIVSESALSTALKAARRAVGDDGRAQRIIATLRRRGYRFVAAAVEETRAPTRGRPRLRGRDREVARLQSMLVSVLYEREAAVSILIGPRGSGRTRLAHEALLSAAGRGMATNIAWCWGETPIPLQAFGDMVARRADRGREPGGLAAVLRRAARLEADEAATLELFESIARDLIRRAAGPGLAIAIDDVDRADAMSLRLLDYLMRACALVTVHFVLVMTDESQTTSGPLSALVERLTRAGVAEKIELGPLQAEEVTTWIESEIGRTLRPAQGQMLFESTEGRPSAIRRVLCWLRTPDGSRWLDAGVTPDRGRMVGAASARRPAPAGRPRPREPRSPPLAPIPDPGVAAHASHRYTTGLNSRA